MRRRLGLVARILGTAAGLLWIAFAIDLHAALDALERIAPARYVAAIALVVANLLLGAIRWHLVMRAYGATRIPPYRRLVYLYFVAFFYNTYLPGAVTGDVGRAVVTHDAFPDAGATGAMAVVFVERLLGLFALFALVAVGLGTAGGALGGRTLWWWTALGVLGSIALVVAIPLARRLAPYLPAPLARIAAKLPVMRDVRPFAAATALSVVSQLAIAIAGWVLLAGVGDVDLAHSLLVVPLAAATAFLPITVGGAGAREAVYVALCGQLFGMPRAAALAASLSLWFAHLVVGLAGAALQLAVRPRKPQ